ncbi:MAG: hypothetical protein EZS28_024393, partial [Streblomastix strix]
KLVGKSNVTKPSRYHAIQYIGIMTASLIDTELREKSFAQICVFSEKAREMHELSKQYQDYFDGQSDMTKQALQETLNLFAECNNQNAPSNKTVDRMDEIVNNHLLDFITILSTFRIWFALQKPEISDSHLFGTEVIENILDLVSKIETVAITGVDRLVKYNSARAKLLVKFFLFPALDDVRIAILELDERELRLDVQALEELRNFYLYLHDSVVKNYEKLKNPPKRPSDN